MDRLRVTEARSVAGQVLKVEWISDIVAIVFIGQSHMWRKVIVKIH